MHSVVVIDDEYIVVEGIKAIIARQKLDYEVVGFAYDGIKALEVILDKKPDLVITDIRIPGLDGLSLIEAAKEELPNTVFVVISGYTEFAYAKRALSLGVKDYIDKPITIEKLSNTLKEVEKSWEQSAENLIDKRKEYIQAVIHGILQQDSEEIRKQINPITKELLDRNLENRELRYEVYKILSMFQGIFEEKSTRNDVEIHVSYSELERMENQQEILEYMKNTIEEIAEKTASDQVGISHKTIVLVLDYINKNYHNDIGLNEIADVVKVNPTYLSILFKDEVGMSYIKYLTNLRVEKAKKLLLEGYKVAEVSEMVGYNNYRYFGDIFKKHVHQTPNEFRGCVRKK